MPAKLLVGCSHGAEDALRVTAAYLAAVAGAEAGRDTVLWLTSDGVRLATDGYADEIRAAPEAPAVRDLHDRFTAAGGRLLACPVALGALGLEEERLAPDAARASAEDVLAWAGDDALAVSF